MHLAYVEVVAMETTTPCYAFVGVLLLEKAGHLLTNQEGNSVLLVFYVYLTGYVTTLLKRNQEFRGEG